MKKPEIKFTTDGKKVVVIGNLNSIEKIVQEVYVIDGSEIPSGEHFVVKTLHDAPAVSWKESELKRIEGIYESKKKTMNSEIDRLETSYRTQRDLLRNKLNYAGKVLKNISPDSFNTLVAYLTNEITWIVKTGSSPELIEFKNFTQNYENKLRLVSIYGDDDGTMTYAIGSYNDYSGHSKFFHPFTKYDEAFDFFKSTLLKQTINDSHLEIADKYGISFPEEGVKLFKSNAAANLVKNIESYEVQIQKWKDKISELTPTA